MEGVYSDSKRMVKTFLYQLSALKTPTLLEVGSYGRLTKQYETKPVLPWRSIFPYHVFTILSKETKNYVVSHQNSSRF